MTANDSAPITSRRIESLSIFTFDFLFSI